MNFTSQFDNLTSACTETIIMSKMPHVDNVAMLKGAEKDEKKAMTDEGAPPPHTQACAHKRKYAV